MAVDFMAVGDNLHFCRRLKQRESASNGVALNRLALAISGDGLGEFS